jgi:hypothetical protein
LPDGTAIFSPIGQWGESYVVPSDERYRRLRLFLIVYWTAWLIINSAVYVLLGSLAGAAAAATIGAAYVVLTKVASRGLEVYTPGPMEEAAEKTVKGKLALHAATMSYFVLVAMFLFAGGFTAISVYATIIDPPERYWAAPSVVLFGAMTVFMGLLLYLRLSSTGRK